VVQEDEGAGTVILQLAARRNAKELIRKAPVKASKSNAEGPMRTARTAKAAFSNRATKTARLSGLRSSLKPRLARNMRRRETLLTVVSGHEDPRKVGEGIWGSGRSVKRSDKVSVGG